MLVFFFLSFFFSLAQLLTGVVALTLHKPISEFLILDISCSTLEKVEFLKGRLGESSYQYNSLNR